MGHQTSVALEVDFWEELSRISVLENKSLAALISSVDEKREYGLASSLRIYVLKYIKKEAPPC